jgi:hypothetical protein
VITAPKELSIFNGLGHARTQAVTDVEHDWVMKEIGRK